MDPQIPHNDAIRKSPPLGGAKCARISGGWACSTRPLFPPPRFPLPRGFVKARYFTRLRRLPCDCKISSRGPFSVARVNLTYPFCARFFHADPFPPRESILRTHHKTYDFKKQLTNWSFFYDQPAIFQAKLTFRRCDLASSIHRAIFQGHIAVNSIHSFPSSILFIISRFIQDCTRDGRYFYIYGYFDSFRHSYPPQM